MKIGVGVLLNGFSPLSGPQDFGDQHYDLESRGVDSFTIASLREGIATYQELHQQDSVYLLIPNDTNRCHGGLEDLGTTAVHWVQDNSNVLPVKSAGWTANNAISEVQSIAELATRLRCDRTIVVIFSGAVAEYFRAICWAVSQHDFPGWNYQTRIAEAPKAALLWWRFYGVLAIAARFAGRHRWTWRCFCRARRWADGRRRMNFYRTITEAADE